MLKQREVQNLLTLERLTNIDVDLGADVWGELLAKAEYKKAKKNEYLQKEGSTINYFFFIVAGIAREHVIFSDGRDVNSAFHVGPVLIGSVFSYRAEIEAGFSLSMVTSGFYYQIESNILIERISKEPNGERWLSAMLARAYYDLQKRLLLLLHKSAEERLVEFIENEPQLFREVPDYHIASYLGITPVTMHRVKAKLAVKSRTLGSSVDGHKKSLAKDLDVYPELNRDELSL